jgi:hypothetical protein
MEHYYKEPFLEGNVVVAIRDREVESWSESQRYHSNVFGEDSLCAFIEGAYLPAKRDGFRKNPELKNGIELRCENRIEAEYLSRVVARQLQGVTPVKITYLE